MTASRAAATFALLFLLLPAMAFAAADDACSDESKKSPGTVTNDCRACVNAGNGTKREVGAWCTVSGGSSKTDASCVPDAGQAAGTCKVTYCTLEGECLNVPQNKVPPPDVEHPKTSQDLKKIYDGFVQSGTPLSELKNLNSRNVDGSVQDWLDQSFDEQATRQIFFDTTSVGQQKFDAAFQELAGGKGDAGAQEPDANLFSPTPQIKQPANLKPGDFGDPGLGSVKATREPGTFIGPHTGFESEDARTEGQRLSNAETFQKSDVFIPEACTGMVCQLQNQLCATAPWTCGAVESVRIGSPSLNECLGNFQSCSRVRTGEASCYGAACGSPQFDGAFTKSGRVFNPNEMTAASQQLPVGTVAEVCGSADCRYVAITDTGGFDTKKYNHRVIDLSPAAMGQIKGSIGGTDTVTVTPVAFVKSANEAVNMTNNLNAGADTRTILASHSKSIIEYGPGFNSVPLHDGSQLAFDPSAFGANPDGSGFYGPQNLSEVETANLLYGDNGAVWDGVKTASVVYAPQPFPEYLSGGNEDIWQRVALAENNATYPLPEPSQFEDTGVTGYSPVGIIGEPDYEGAGYDGYAALNAEYSSDTGFVPQGQLDTENLLYGDNADVWKRVALDAKYYSELPVFQDFADGYEGSLAVSNAQNTELGKQVADVDRIDYLRENVGPGAADLYTRLLENAQLAGRFEEARLDAEFTSAFGDYVYGPKTPEEVETAYFLYGDNQAAWDAVKVNDELYVTNTGYFGDSTEWQRVALAENNAPLLYGDNTNVWQRITNDSEFYRQESSDFGLRGLTAEWPEPEQLSSDYGLDGLTAEWPESPGSALPPRPDPYSPFSVQNLYGRLTESASRRLGLDAIPQSVTPFPDGSDPSQGLRNYAANLDLLYGDNADEWQRVALAENNATYPLPEPSQFEDTGVTGYSPVGIIGEPDYEGAGYDGYAALNAEYSSDTGFVPQGQLDTENLLYGDNADVWKRVALDSEFYRQESSDFGLRGLTAEWPDTSSALPTQPDPHSPLTIPGLYERLTEPLSSRLGLGVIGKNAPAPLRLLDLGASAKDVPTSPAFDPSAFGTNPDGSGFYGPQNLDEVETANLLYGDNADEWQRVAADDRIYVTPEPDFPEDATEEPRLPTEVPISPLYEGKAFCSGTGYCGDGLLREKVSVAYANDPNVENKKFSSKLLTFAAPASLGLTPGENYRLVGPDGKEVVAEYNDKAGNVVLSKAAMDALGGDGTTQVKISSLGASEASVPIPPERPRQTDLPVTVPSVGEAKNPAQLWGDEIPSVAERRALYERLESEKYVPEVTRYTGTERQNRDLIEGLRRREEALRSAPVESNGPASAAPEPAVQDTRDTVFPPDATEEPPPDAPLARSVAQNVPDETARRDAQDEQSEEVPLPRPRPDSAPQGTPTMQNTASPEPVRVDPVAKNARALQYSVNRLGTRVSSFINSPTPQNLDRLVRQVQAIQSWAGKFPNDNYIQSQAAQIKELQSAANFPPETVASYLKTYRGQISKGISTIRSYLNGQYLRQ